MKLTPIKCLNVKKKGEKKSIFSLLSVSNFYNLTSFVFCSPGKTNKYVILTLIRKIPVKLLDMYVFFLLIPKETCPWQHLVLLKIIMSVLMSLLPCFLFLSFNKLS